MRTAVGIRFVLFASLLLLASVSQAQLPSICPEPAPSMFTKTVCVVDPMTGICPSPQAPPIAIGEGDLLEYEIIRCNDSGSPCLAPIQDSLDAQTSAPSRLSWVDSDLLTSCTLGPTEMGGAICEQGGPGSWSPAGGLQRCGQDCATCNSNPTDPSCDTGALAPGFMALLADGVCYRFVLRAQVETPLTATECLCNQAETIIDPTGLTASSHDPGWVSLQGMGVEIMCDDPTTCPGSKCKTCGKFTLIPVELFSFAVE